MLLIISGHDDLLLANLIKWLMFVECNYVVDNKFEIENYCIQNSNLYFKNEIITGVYLRNPKYINAWQLGSANNNTGIRNQEVRNFYETEKFHFFQSIIILLANMKRNIGIHHVYTNIGVVKYEVLLMASKLSLKTPNTYLINSNSNIYNALDKNTKYINKPISDPVFIKNDLGFTETMYSNYITFSCVLKKIKKTPILVQEYIRSDFEIRTFYLDPDFFSVAYIPYGIERHVDIRENLSKSNVKIVSFQLPNKLKLKISKLLKHLRLNCCSVDILYNCENNEFTLLEVNPWGIYDNISVFCNYNLNFKIAEYFNK